MNGWSCWYHWSPTDRRKSIIRKGLEPGRWSTDRLWKPPYVCLAPSPNVGWSLSGAMLRGSEIASWDLWEVLIDPEHMGGIINYYTSGAVKEMRVYERIYKRYMWYVGTRVRTAIKNS